jgi:DNA-binding beta-propeller fold protein YncE
MLQGFPDTRMLGGRNPMSAGRNGRGAARGMRGLIAALACGVMLAWGGPAVAGARAATSGSITTVAGGVGGPAKATAVSLDVCGVAFGGGKMYIPSEEAVRAVDPATDWLTTPAGSGVSGPFVEGGAAADATMDACAAAVDHQGNLLIADLQNERIRVVATTAGTFYGRAMKARHIYTVAGTGTPGYSGDGGPATSAELSGPEAAAVDATGNLVIADNGNNRIRVVAESTGTFYGRAMTAGDIYTVAGGKIAGYNGDGPAARTDLFGPSGVALDGAGNLVIADSDNGRIRVLAG